MKRMLQMLIPVALLLAACSKEQSQEFVEPDPNNPGGPGNGGGGGNNTGYFLKCKVGGDAKTFNLNMLATKQSDQGMTIMMVLGKANNSNTESFTFTISSDADITAGTYKVNDAAATYDVVATWITANPTISYWAMTGDAGGDAFQITISSINATEMTGTFRGTVFEVNVNNPSPTPPTKTITEGEFKVKFQ